MSATAMLWWVHGLCVITVILLCVIFYKDGYMEATSDKKKLNGESSEERNE